MGIINLYSGLNSERKIYNFNGKIKDHIDLNWEHTEILKNEKKLNPDYEVKENDVLIIQEYPSGITALAITLAVVAIGVAIGVSIYAKNQAEKARQEMEEALKRIGKNNKQKDVSSIPMLADARNERAEGKNIPIILGRHIFAPYFISEPYMRPSGTDGEDLYWYGTFLCGQTGLCFENIRNGSINLVTLEGDTAQSGIFDFQNPGGIDPPFYTSENMIEISQEEYEFTNPIFKEKWVDSLDSSVEIARRAKDGAQTIDGIYIDDNGAEPIIRETSRFPMRAEIELMVDGLYGWDSSHGVPTQATVGIIVEWSKDQLEWEQIPINFNDLEGENQLIRAKSSQMRFLAEIDFPPSVFSKKGTPVFIKATRTTRMHSGSYRDRVYLSAIRTKQYNPRTSSSSELISANNINDIVKNNFCLMGIKLKVNQNTQEFLDRFNIVASMTARMWNGEWSANKYKTSNSASVLLEVITGLIHEESKFEDQELNMESFGKLYDYCANREVKTEDEEIEEFSLECNGVVTSGTKKIDIINSILATCDGGLYIDEFSKLQAYYDDVQDVPIALLNPQRILKITEQKSFNRKTDGYSVEFIDQEADWMQSVHRILRPGIEINPGRNTYSQIKLDFTTSYYQAMWHAIRIMAKEKHRKSEFTVSVGKEGRYYKPGSLIKVQHERFKLGIGSGEIIDLVKEGKYIVGLLLMEIFEIASDCDYWIDYYVVDEKRNHVVTKQIKNTSKKTNILFFSVPILADSLDAPVVGNIVSVVWEAKRVLVSDLSEIATGYELKLTPYNSAIYETATLNKIPDYISNISNYSSRIYDALGRKPIDGGSGQGLVTPDFVFSSIDSALEGEGEGEGE